MSLPATVAGDLAAASLRLYGRDLELGQVQAALEDVSLRAVIARGPPGVGKTALLRRAMLDAQETGALAGAGKHPEGRSGGGLEPLVQALEAAVAAGLDQLFDPDAGLEDLFRSLGPNRELFAGLGARLLRGPASAARTRAFTAAEADERLIQAILQCLTWLEGFGAPVLLLIDDWGRAGAQAQQAYRRILDEPRLARTRILATERPEEPLRATLPPVAAVVQVGPLDRAAQEALARAMLPGRGAVVDQVLDLLGPAADLPFDLVQSIHLLLASGAISGAKDDGRLDLSLAGPALAGTAADSVVRHVAQSGPETLRLAQLLAVCGDEAAVYDLAAAADLPAGQFARALDALTSGGLVAAKADNVAYTHDRLRAAVLQRLTPGQRAKLAATLAETLRRLGVDPADGTRGAAMLWRRLDAGLKAVDAAWWRTAFTHGAEQARERGDRDAAERFVTAALELTVPGQAPDFPLAAEAALAAVARGDHADVGRYGDAMLRAARTPAERAAADEMRVFARRMSGDLDAALEVAREVLARVRVILPRRPTLAAVAIALGQALTLPPPRNPRPLPPEALELEAPLMRATNGIGSLLFERSPLMAMILVTRAVPRRIAYGTAAGAASYALLCGLLGAYRRAARWAEAADRLQGPGQPLRAVAKQYATSFGHVFVRPRASTRTRGAEMEELAYAGGDLPVAAYGNRDKVLDALFTEDPLEDTVRLAEESIRVAERLNDTPTIRHMGALRQFIEQVQAPTTEPARLDGGHFDLEAAWTDLSRRRLGNTARAVAALQALLAVLHGRYGDAAALASRPWPRFAAAPFQAQTQLWAFATGLALYRTGGRLGQFALWNLRRLAKLNPADFAHRARLLEAEQARVRGRRRRAVQLYAAAASAAAASNSSLEQGLVAAAAAEGCVSIGEFGLADAYREEAIAAWRALGAEGVLASRFGFPSAKAAPGPAAPDPDQAARELELLAARDAAERSSRAKARLLATVGHELRTPLQGALGLLELADKTARPLDVQSLRQAVASLAGVVGDLTDLGALEGGVLSVTRAPFDARATAASVAALHAATAHAACRRIVHDASGPPLWVTGDEGRVRQVLGNLVANALRHGQGEVQVRLARPAADRIVFTVSDEGPPLAEGEMRRIFEPFERGEDRADDGLGVGLFLGRHLARRMGGDLTVSPTQAGGKAFRLEVMAPPAEPPVNAGAGLAGLRVLLAEDNPLSRDVLSALLRHEGCTVAEAKDGAEAAERLGDDSFDLVLLDQRMPRRTGSEVARDLAGGAQRPLVVLMSASADLDGRGLDPGAGIDLVLQKPVSLQALRELAGRATSAASAPQGQDRLAELKRQLGPEGPALFREVRGSVEAELSVLAASADNGDLKAFGEQQHRLRGLARHFGLDDLATALDDDGRAADAEAARDLVRGVEQMVRDADWSPFEEA